MQHHHSPKLLTSLFITALICAGQSVAQPAHAEGVSNTLYVAPGGTCGGFAPCYSTIQTAVDAAAPGDAIKVAAGTYTNPSVYVVRITKSVALLGGYAITDWNNADPVANPTVIDGQNQVGRRGIVAERVTADPVSVSVVGFTVRNANNAPPQSCAGICMLNVSSDIHSNIVISNTGGGIAIAGGDATVRQNTIEYSKQDAFDKNGYGILLEGTDALAEANLVRFNEGQGITSWEGSNARIFNNTVRDNAGNGITSSTSRSFWVDGNRVERNGFRGIASQFESGRTNYSGFITITNNLVSGSKLFGLYMEQTVIVTGTVANNIFTDNDFYGAQMSMGAGTVLTFTQNSFSKNPYGGINTDVRNLAEINVLTNTVQDNGGTGIVLRGSRNNKVLVQGNLISANKIARPTDTSGGGGIRVEGGNVRIVRNRITNNVINGFGGGIFIDGKLDPFFFTQVQLNGNQILTNTSLGLGSGIAIGGGVVTATNDIIARNYAELPAVYVFSGTLTANHWTLANNGSYAVRVFFGGVATISNTLVAGHSVAGLEQSAGGVLVADRILSWQNGAACANSATCTNVIEGDPLFFNNNALDFHITPGSAAIDQASVTATSDDVDGPGRPQGTAPDIGADEIGNYTPQLVVFIPLVQRQ
jgi:parallel beta-helix repeat protein